MDDADTFLGWVNNLMIARPEDDPDGSIRMGAAMAIFSYLGQLVGQRYSAPGDDLTTALIGHTVNERPLDAQEVVRINFQLCMAGIDTLAGVLGYVFSISPRTRRTGRSFARTRPTRCLKSCFAASP